MGPIGHTLTRASLTSLPPEILLDVLCVLQPPNVLRMRTTGKCFYNLSFTRSIWLRALHEIIRYFQLPLTTFDIQRMSTAELEYAATRPWRVQHAVFRRGVAKTVGRTVDLGHHSLKIRAACLVPGGRWLVTTGWMRISDDIHDLHHMSVWDLKGNCTRPVATAMLPVAPRHHDLAIQSSGGQGANILARSQFSHTGVAEWSVFSLKTADEPVSLTRVRTCRIAGTEGSMGTLLQGDCAVIPQHGGNLVVWNYMSDEWAQMVDEDAEDYRTVTVLPIADSPHLTVIRPPESDIQTYNIPDLIPRDPTCVVPPIVYVDPISVQPGLPSISDVRTVSAQQWLKRPASIVLVRAESDAMVVRRRIELPPKVRNNIGIATSTTGVFRILKGLPPGDLLWFTGQCVETIGGCILAMFAEREDDGSVGPTHLIALQRDSLGPAVSQLVVRGNPGPASYPYPYSRTICPVTGTVGEVTGRRHVTLYSLIA